MKNHREFYSNTGDYADMDYAGAAAHLSNAIQFNTTSYADTTLIDYGEFDKFHDFLKTTYPAIMHVASFELIDKSVLIRIEGRDSSLKPGLMMAHQDVVPVVKGTENDWLHGPFSGDISEGFIWGRGALDIKVMLIAIMETVSYIIQKRGVPNRTTYLAFGQDEETLNLGAHGVALELKKRGVDLEFVLDEGGSAILEGDMFGAPERYFSTIDCYEKGYLDLKLSVQSAGGHSSCPMGGTSLGKLATAISRIVGMDYPKRLQEITVEQLNSIKDFVTEEPMKTLLSDIESNEQKIVEYFLTKRELFPTVQTTCAPTMISGGSNGANVMPQNMEAVINFRLAQGDTVESILSEISEVVDGLADFSVIQGNDPSRVSRYDGFGYSVLKQTLDHYYEDLNFVPGFSTGATDARHYELVCDTCLRYSPFIEDREISRTGVHGTNERISIEAYEQGLRCMAKFFELACY